MYLMLTKDYDIHRVLCVVYYHCETYKLSLFLQAGYRSLTSHYIRPSVSWSDRWLDEIFENFQRL